FCTLFAGSIVDTWHQGLGWHDQQRIYQLILLVVVAVGVLVLPFQALPRNVFILLLAILGLGLWSSLCATWTGWALKEWGRYVGLTLLVLVFAQLGRKNRLQRFLLYL